MTENKVGAVSICLEVDGNLQGNLPGLDVFVTAKMDQASITNRSSPAQAP